jgi:hypothetical protein
MYELENCCYCNAEPRVSNGAIISIHTVDCPEVN